MGIGVLTCAAEISCTRPAKMAPWILAVRLLRGRILTGVLDRFSRIRRPCASRRILSLSSRGEVRCEDRGKGRFDWMDGNGNEDWN